MRDAVIISTSPTIVRTPNAVLWWATQKRRSMSKGGRTGDLIRVAPGQKFFSSRISGSLTVHGSAKPRAWEIARVRGLDQDSAVVELLREHCQHLKATGNQRLFGIGWRLSVDPVKAAAGVRRMLDLDRALVAAAEATFGPIGKRLFGESDISFILRISHGVRTFMDSGRAEAASAKGQAAANPSRERVQLRVLLLPPVGGIRKADPASQESWLDNLQLEELVKDALGIFSFELVGQVYNNSQIEPVLAEEWEAILKEACVSSMENLGEAGGVGDMRRESGYVLIQFRSYMRMMTREKLREQHEKRLAQVHRFVAAASLTGSNVVLSEGASRLAKTEGQWRKNLGWQLELAEKALANYQVQPTHAIQFWDVPACKTFIPSADSNALKAQPNRTQTIGNYLGELRQARMAARIYLMGELALLEMKLNPTLNQAKNLKWIRKLKDISEMEVLPHQDLLNAREIPSK